MKEMKTTNRKNSGWGFAVPAVLLNITVGGMLVVGTGTLGFSSMHKVATMASYPSLNNQSQTAGALIGQDVRRATSIERAGSDEIVFNVRGVEGISTVAYNYDAIRHTVTRTEGARTQTVLSNVDSFGFSLFQRPAKDAAFDVLAPATAQNARVVRCHWSCSRKLTGARLDAETVELAPIVLRNHC
jgi:hypothetical protein